MSKMKTGWVIKNEDGKYVFTKLAYTAHRSRAKVFGLKREAAAFCEDGERVVKVEWQPQVVREVG